MANIATENSFELTPALRIHAARFTGSIPGRRSLSWTPLPERSLNRYIGRPSTSLTLDQLPDEIIEAIFVRVPFTPGTFRMIRMVCRKFFNFIEVHVASPFWEKIAKQQFPLLHYVFCAPGTTGYLTLKDLKNIDTAIKATTHLVKTSMTDEDFFRESTDTDWQEVFIHGLLIWQKFQEVNVNNLRDIGSLDRLWRCSAEWSTDTHMLVRYACAKIGKAIATTLRPGDATAGLHAIHPNLEDLVGTMHMASGVKVPSAHEPILITTGRNLTLRFPAYIQADGRSSTNDTDFEAFLYTPTRSRDVGEIEDLRCQRLQRIIERWFTEEGINILTNAIIHLKARDLDQARYYPGVRGDWDTFVPYIPTRGGGNLVSRQELMDSFLLFDIDTLVDAELLKENSKLRLNMAPIDQVFEGAIESLKQFEADEAA